MLRQRVRATATAGQARNPTTGGAGSPRGPGVTPTANCSAGPAQDAGRPPCRGRSQVGPFSPMLNHPSGANHLQPKNLAARAGRWSATHRKTAIIGWVLFVVLATVIGGK